jgi:hypothetical protein
LGGLILSRIPTVRVSAALILAVFVVGAGIGAAIIAVTHRTRTQRLVINEVATRPSARTNRSAPHRPSAVSTATAHRPAAPVSHRAPARATPTYEPTTPADADASFTALQSGLAGSVGLAVAPLGAGPIDSFGALQIAHAWSTSKVPVLTTLLRDDEQTGQRLSAEQRTDATLALVQSDNAAIEALFAALEQLHGGLVSASAAV